jgi:hypothetical protein
MIENDINDDTLKLPLCNGLAEVNLPIMACVINI